MTDNEIIKALECCTNSRADCSECPYLGAEIKDKITCELKMTKNALDLINRQKAEIEKLEERDETAEKIIREQADKVLTLLSENSRLADRNSMLSEKADNSVIACLAARTEAIKEFAQMLKSMYGVPDLVLTDVLHLSLNDVQLDDLVKEMVGENQ